MSLIEITLPEVKESKGSFGPVRYIAGKNYSLWYLTLIYLGISLSVWALLFIFTYSSDDNHATALAATGAISATIFIGSMTSLLLSKSNSGLEEIIALNRGRLQALDKFDVSNSVIFTIARQKLKGFDDGTASGRTSNSFKYGIAETVNDGQRFTIGRLTNVGPFARYACATITLAGAFPHSLIDACKDERLRDQFQFRQRLSQGQKYDLEGEFYDRFDAYAASPANMRALTYLLTPDIMMLILEVMPSMDIELVDNMMIFAWPESSLQNGSENWPEILSNASKVLNMVGERLDVRATNYLSYKDPQSQLDPSVYLRLTAEGRVLESLKTGKVNIWNRFSNLRVVLAVAFAISLIAASAILVIIQAIRS